jgi:hypothetical protein
VMQELQAVFGKRAISRYDLSQCSQ